MIREGRMRRVSADDRELEEFHCEEGPVIELTVPGGPPVMLDHELVTAGLLQPVLRHPPTVQYSTVQ